MKRKPVVWVLLAILIAGSRSFSQQPVPGKDESLKYRTILSVAGGGGGFTLGVYGGIWRFDNSTNATRKVWTTALISAAGGAVGGYFLGRYLDKRHNRRATAPMPARAPDPLDQSLELAGRPVAVPCAKDGLVRQPEPGFRYPLPAPCGCGGPASR